MLIKRGIQNFDLRAKIGQMGPREVIKPKGAIHISGDTKFGFFFTLPPYYDTMMTLWSDPSLPMMTGDTWHSHIIIEYRSSALKHDIIFERFLRRNKETKKCKFEATLKNVYKIALTAA